MNSYGMFWFSIRRNACWFLVSAFLLTVSHDLSAGNARELSEKWGHPVEVFPVARQIEAPGGHVILKAPSPEGNVLKRVENPGLVNVKARMIGNGGVYFISDWSWQRYTEGGKEPNWVTIVGHGATIDVERTLNDDSGPLVRLRYLTLREAAVGMVLDENPTLGTFLGSKGNFMTAKNAVHQKLADIAKRHTQTLSNEDGLWYYRNPNTESRIDAGQLLRYITGTLSIFSNASYAYHSGLPTIARRALFPGSLAASCQLLFTANSYDASDAKQRIMRSLNRGTADAEDLMFVGHLKPDLALRLMQLDDGYGSEERKELASFYREITALGAPSDFFELGMIYNACGSSWEIAIQPRLLCLRVLVLENIAHRDLPIGEFVVEEIGQLPLGASLDPADLVSRRRRYLASATLKAGEQLIIPLQLTFPAPSARSQVFAWQDNAFLERLVDLAPAAVESALQKHDQVNVIEPQWEWGHQESEARVLFQIPKDTFLDCYTKNRFRSSGKDYYYGPTAQPIEASIDGKYYSIRQFEPESLLIAQSIDAGSCPTIYAVNRWDQRERVGHFLTGRDSAGKEGFYRIPLKDFGGVLEVVEDDAETSFIKWMRLRCVDAKGAASLLYPSHPLIGDPENGYQKFEQGDRLTVEFPDFDPDGAHKTVWLEGLGYYVPYASVAER